LIKNGYKYAMEPLAMTGAYVDKDKGILSMIALEMGGSSDFCQYLKPGEVISLMGPTGAPTELPYNQTVMLLGGGLGNAVLFSIGQALLENGCKVLYFAGYKKSSDRYKEQEIESASDIAVWCCDDALLTKNRDSDFNFQGNIIQAIEWYGVMDNQPIRLDEVDRIIVIGSDKMMAAVTYARYHHLKSLFKTSCITIGSINSPMQCMMKGICAQCLQKHVDADGKESYVYSCVNQDQELDKVDFQCLHLRLSQNKIMELGTKNIIYQ
jgi:NAD(P)H-flavin reductase